MKYWVYFRLIPQAKVKIHLEGEHAFFILQVLDSLKRICERDPEADAVQSTLQH